MILNPTTHRHALQTSSKLTRWFHKMRGSMGAMAKPEKVIRVLKDAGVRFVVMGTHGIVGYRSEPRGTQDVDVLVAKRDHRKAVEAIRGAFPKLVVEDHAVVTRFVHPATGKSVIDLMKPVFPLYRLTFRHTVAVGQDYDIPTLEMVLAAKFAAMVSPHRDPAKKHVDASDFLDVVRQNRSVLDLEKLRRFADVVFPGGGDEVVKIVADIDAGRTIKV